MKAQNIVDAYMTALMGESLSDEAMKRLSKVNGMLLDVEKEEGQLKLDV